MSVTIYHYPKCSTCRKALKWLTERDIDYAAIDIVTSPPSRVDLEAFYRSSGLPLKRFFNTSGLSYRGGGFKDRLPTMSEAEQLDALAADGKLMKRPLLVSDEAILVGFKAAEYDAAFG